MRPLLLALTLSLPLALACKGAEGDTCKEDNDCSSGLLCCGEMFGRGTCEMSCDVPTDSGPPVDTGAADAETDAGDDASDVGLEDTGPDDAGPEDTGPDDVGPDDAGPEDAGDAGDAGDAADDAATDAGDDAGDAGDDAGT